MSIPRLATLRLSPCYDMLKFAKIKEKSVGKPFLRSLLRPFSLGSWLGSLGLLAIASVSPALAMTTAGDNAMTSLAEVQALSAGRGAAAIR